MNKKVIIIGATSGIGKELAILYLADNNNVAVTGRRQNLLDELKSQYTDNIIAACFDVMGNENVAQLQQLINALGGLDILIYNAGYGDPSLELDWQKENIITQTNVNGFLEITNYTFNYFIRQGCGQIAVISSIAALRGNRMSPAYSASKAYMSIYAEGLNIKAGKLRKNIVVTDVKPGFVNTKPAEHKRFWVASPEKAARQIKRAIENKKRVVYVTKRWWLIAQVLKVLPYWFYRKLV